MKLYVPDGEDIGRYINENLHDLPDLERTYTIQKPLMPSKRLIFEHHRTLNVGASHVQTASISAF